MLQKRDGLNLFIFLKKMVHIWERGKNSISAETSISRVRISPAHLPLFPFPFVLQLQDCLKSYGRGDENSYKRYCVAKLSSRSPFCSAPSETRPSIVAVVTFLLPRIWILAFVFLIDVQVPKVAIVHVRVQTQRLSHAQSLHICSLGTSARRLQGTVKAPLSLA